VNGYLDLSQLHEARVDFDGIANQLGRLFLSFSMEDNLLLLLFSLHHQVLGTFSLLLSHLLSFHCLLIFWAEVEVGDGNVVQQNSKLGRSFDQSCPNRPAHELSLRDELCSIVLGNYALENLVDDGRQDFLIKVQAKGPVDSWQLSGIRLAEASQGDVHHLQVLTACQGGHGVRPGTNIEDDSALQPWEDEVYTLSVVVRTNATEAVVLHSHVACFD